MDLPCIALLTDFGTRDGFVGVMKGVIYTQIQTAIPVVDISHGIAPQDIRQGAWVLQSAYPYFPPQTVFVAVIDPGVGLETQAPLLCHWPERRQVFIAPDNGLLSPVLHAAGEVLQCYDLRGADFYRQGATTRSRTFHGRDVYAPAAAQVANAMQSGQLAAFLEALAIASPKPVRFSQSLPEQTRTDQGLVLSGEVVYVDLFGNLITNLPQAWVWPGATVSVSLAGQLPFASHWAPTYAAAQDLPQPVVLIPSSGGTLELAAFQGSAQSLLQAQAGMSIRLTVTPNA